MDVGRGKIIEITDMDSIALLMCFPFRICSFRQIPFNFKGYKNESLSTHCRYELFNVLIICKVERYVRGKTDRNS